MTQKFNSLPQTSCVFCRVLYVQPKLERTWRLQCSLVNRFPSSKNLTLSAYYSWITFNPVITDFIFLLWRLESWQRRFIQPWSERPRDTKAIQNNLFKFCLSKNWLNSSATPGAKLTLLNVRLAYVWPYDKISWSKPSVSSIVYKMTRKTLTNAENS